MVRTKTPAETAERREEVKDFMETLGPYSVPKKILAEKHGVTIKVIYNDIQFWINKIDLKRMDIEGRKLIMSVMKNMSITEGLKSKGTSAEQIKAIQASNQTAETLTKLMENYGFKDKIAENLNVHNNQDNIFNLIVKPVEEIKLEKLNNQPKAK